MHFTRWATHNIFNASATFLIMSGGSYIAYKIIETIAHLLLQKGSEEITEDINLLKEEDRHLIREIIHWVEVKLPDSVGEDKKLLAVSTITTAIPLLSKNDAGKLVDDLVSEMKQELKKIESGII